jgi:hypothetical protein
MHWRPPDNERCQRHCIPTPKHTVTAMRPKPSLRALMELAECGDGRTLNSGLDVKRTDVVARCSGRTSVSNSTVGGLPSGSERAEVRPWVRPWQHFDGTHAANARAAQPPPQPSSLIRVSIMALARAKCVFVCANVDSFGRAFARSYARSRLANSAFFRTSRLLSPQGLRLL